MWLVATILESTALDSSQICTDMFCLLSQHLTSFRRHTSVWILSLFNPILLVTPLHILFLSDSKLGYNIYYIFFLESPLLQTEI